MKMGNSIYQGRPAHEDRVGKMEKGDYFNRTFRDDLSERESESESESETLGIRERVQRSFAVRVMMSIAALVLLSLGYSVAGKPVPDTTPDQSPCNTIDGYRCFSNVSHHWGHYAPYFAVGNQPGLSGEVPSECQITFANVLSRHGARFPTASKGSKYSSLIEDIQNNATSFPDKYAFLETYEYNLGEDDLTQFGENQLVNSGIKFYNRYENLTKNIIPFIRASGSDRVIASGEKFIEGFQSAKANDTQAKPNQKTPSVNVVIAEGTEYNNTLDHSTCTSFENNDDFEDHIVDNFTALFTPSIRKRLEADLSGTSFSDTQITYLMDMCAFDTVARTPDGSSLSPFCDIFTDEEWRQYNYFNSLKKYYGYGAGNPLGPAQGIGYTNELIARLTQTPVHDHTSTNHTLDSNPNTFPLNTTLYADFGHDNGMVSIFFALGLYNNTQALSHDTIESAEDAGGYSASWAVPFAARAYIEMMQCGGETEPLVRVLVNDRVAPLHGCKADKMGRCRRDEFVRGLGYARSGGNWGSCFK